jgi:hypothetical protein
MAGSRWMSWTCAPGRQGLPKPGDVGDVAGRKLSPGAHERRDWLLLSCAAKVRCWHLSCGDGRACLAGGLISTSRNTWGRARPRRRCDVESAVVLPLLMGVLVLDCRWADIKSHGERKEFSADFARWGCRGFACSGKDSRLRLGVRPVTVKMAKRPNMLRKMRSQGAVISNRRSGSFFVMLVLKARASLSAGQQDAR